MSLPGFLDAAVIPAQDAWPDLKTLLGGQRTLFADIDCPPGEVPYLATECTLWIPIFDCVFVGGGDYTCWYKGDKCLSYRETWQCRPRTLTRA
jgi:hypothetical protein